MRNEDELMNYAIKQEAICRKNDSISDALFEEYGVNRGLRDMNGKGVLTGLTTISKIISFQNVNGVQTPCDGQLWYRGYNVQNLVKCMALRRLPIFYYLGRPQVRKNCRSFVRLWHRAAPFLLILPEM